jgi:hypothetical protein
MMSKRSIRTCLSHRVELLTIPSAAEVKEEASHIFGQKERTAGRRYRRHLIGKREERSAETERGIGAVTLRLRFITFKILPSTSSSALILSCEIERRRRRFNIRPPFIIPY